VGVAKAAEQFEREIDVLIEDVDEDGTPVGRWRGQAPEVDGVVLLDSGTVGTIVRTRIVDVLGYDLEGEVL
jgi:tRNA A37 methylthiotransferase MiaB